MAKKPKTKNTVEITGKCISCGKKEVLTANQILLAEMDGVAMSTCCSFPMTIEKAKIN